MMTKIFIGIISVTRSGLGFVAHENFTEDILIDRELLGTALHGDEVEVLILPSARKGRANGKVLKVLKRARERFVGILKKENNKILFVPDNQRMNIDFLIVAPSKEVREGQKVLVKMHKWQNEKEQPTAEVIKILGKAGEHETEMQAILLEKDFEGSFPVNVQKAAQQIQSQLTKSSMDHSSREDFREVFTCTIDPTDAKDFDDALSIKKLEHDNYEIGIHIADVTHFVKPDSIIDKEARKRCTSVYLVDRTIPMLPEELSNDVCSLKAGVDRFAFATIFVLNQNAKVQSVRFAKTIIKSDERLSYKEAQNILNSNECSRGSLLYSLCVLRDLARKLRKDRVKDGAIEFETDEVGFDLDKNKKPIRVFVKEKLETMKIVEEFMLLANKTVAEHLSYNSKNDMTTNMSIYRVHGDPDANKIEELKIFLKALGHDQLETGTKQLESKDLANLMRAIKGTPEEAIIQTATLRAMAKAIYSHKNVGHFSLGFKHYTHFTSPIRRYPDIMVHRILKAHLDGTVIPKEEMNGYIKSAILASEREVEAVAAERESTKYKQIEYMKEQIGKTFIGTITGVTKSGFFVAEDESRAEGFISANSLKDDWYELDKKSYALIGKQKKKRYRIGDKIKIKLKRASIEDRQIDWEII